MSDVAGLVVALQDYKDKDGIVFVLTPESIQSVYARGIQNPASKNRRLCNPFSEVSLIVADRKMSTMDFLIKGSVLAYYHTIQDDLVAQSVCFVLRDCLFRVAIVPMYSSLLKEVWQAYNRKESSALTYACLLMAQILKNEGIAPHVDACVGCGSKRQIETLSKPDGGFLCVRCNQGRYPKWEKTELEKIRALFIVKETLVEPFAQSARYDLDDFLFLAKWFELFSHTELASVRFLASIRTLEAK